MQYDGSCRVMTRDTVETQLQDTSMDSLNDLCAMVEGLGWEAGNGGVFVVLPVVHVSVSSSEVGCRAS